MVNLNAAKAINSKFFKLHTAAALIVGGTSGIGQSIAFRIAHYSEKPVIVISGRNEERGQTTIEALQKINKEGSYSYEKSDIASLDDSRALVDRLSKKYNAFNLLIISSGGLSTKQRTLTVDGIDERMAVNFFGRFHLINRMLPLLSAASDKGEHVAVLSVLSAGEGTLFKPDDIGLTENYSLLRAASQSSICNDLMAEELSNRYPNISFNHAHPGIVNTNVGSSLPWYLKYPVQAMLFFGFSPEDSADYLLSGVTSSDREGGWALLNRKGDPMKPTRFQTLEAREKVWSYSAQITGLDI